MSFYLARVGSIILGFHLKRRKSRYSGPFRELEILWFLTVSLRGLLLLSTWGLFVPFVNDQLTIYVDGQTAHALESQVFVELQV